MLNNENFAKYLEKTKNLIPEEELEIKEISKKARFINKIFLNSKIPPNDNDNLKNGEETKINSLTNFDLQKKRFNFIDHNYPDILTTETNRISKKNLKKKKIKIDINEKIIDNLDLNYENIKRKTKNRLKGLYGNFDNKYKFNCDWV